MCFELTILSGCWLSSSFGLCSHLLCCLLRKTLWVSAKAGSSGYDWTGLLCLALLCFSSSVSVSAWSCCHDYCHSHWRWSQHSGRSLCHRLREWECSSSSSLASFFECAGRQSQHSWFLSYIVSHSLESEGRKALKEWEPCWWFWTSSLYSSGCWWQGCPSQTSLSCSCLQSWFLLSE